MADTQINVGMNVDGVTTGTEKVKRSLKDLGTSARDASTAVGGMGDGGSKSAEKVEAATRSMIGSIQRQIAATEAGDKSSRKYQESLAKMRGVDTNALKPYLDQLDAAKAKQDGLTASLGSIGTAAFAAATAFVAVGSGIAAMTKQVVDGLDALNDLKDATGASIENISALEDVALRTGANFDVVSTSLIKLNQGLNSAKPGSDTEAALKAIGLSVKDLKDMDPAEAFQKIAVGLSGFADDANKARITQELFGKSLKEVAPLLKDVAENGKLNGTVTTAQAEAAERLNKQMFNLQKNALDVRRAFVSDLIPAISDAVDRFILAQKHAGSLLGVLAMYNRLDYSKGIQGNLGEVEKQIAALEERATRITSSGAKTGNDKMIADLKAQSAYLKELRQMKILAEQEDASDAVSRKYSKPKPTIGDLPDQAAIKAAAAEAKKAVAEQNKELAAQSKLLAENAGLTGSFSEDWSRLVAIYKSGKISLSELTAAQAKLLSNQPAIKAANDAEAKSAAELEKANMAALDARQKYNEYLDKGLSNIQDENQKIQDHIDRLGLNKEAIAELDAQRLESQAVTQDLIVLKKIEQGLDESQYEIYVKTSAELRKQAALKRSSASKESEIEAAKETAKAASEEWKRGWEETDKLARDAFTAWAADGSNAAQKIGDTLKKALLSAIYEATLKPLVFQLYTSIAGGAPGGALGAINGAGSLFGSGSSGLSSTFSALGGNLASGFRAGLGAVFGESGTLGGLSAGTTALGAGNVMGGLGTLAGTVMPWLAGASLLQSLTGYSVKSDGSALLANLGGGTTQGVAIRSDFTQSSSGIFSGGTTHNSDWKDADAQVTQFIQQQVKLVTDSARAYGTALGLPVDSLDSFKKQIEVSLTGLDAAGVQKALQGAIDGFANDLVSSSFGDALKDVAREGETSAQTLTRLSTDLAGVNQVFDSVGHHLLDVSVSGAAAASGLVQAAGGLSNLQSQLQSMYAQLASAQQDLADANRNAYDLMVESQDQAKKVLGNDSGGGGGGGGGGSNAIADAIKYLADLKTGIQQWIDKLNSTQEGGLGLQAQRDNAWAALQTQLVLARGGDRTALSGITGYASTYIGAVQGTARTSAEEQIAIGRVKAQLSKLPDQVPPEKLIVDAINSNGGSGGAVATAVKSLGNKLTAELTVSARSEIVKMIEFVADTDKLPYDLKQLALASADTMTKTVSFITGSKLTEENKQLALGTSSQLTKTINYGLGLDIPDEYKRIALKASDSIEKTISYTARNVLDPKQAALALMADNTIVKTLELAAGRLDPEALKVAYAQSETIRKMIEASGGVLTEDQQMLLNNVVDYNKQVNLQVHLDENALTAAEDFLQTRFNTLDIKTVLKANDPTTVLRDFINSQISGGINGIAVFNVYQAAKTYGFTQQDIANAMGRSLAEVQDIFGQYGIPKFAVGADYIPQDMLAVVHKGEQIVPAAYNPNAAGNQRIDTGALERRIEALQADARVAQATMAALMSRLVKLNEKWDGDGLPETRSVAA